MTENIIRERLSFLSPRKLEIINESHLHKGHAGNNGGEHFKIKIQSLLFQDKSMVERHKIIYEALGDLIPKTIHAISIKAEAPES